MLGGGFSFDSAEDAVFDNGSVMRREDSESIPFENDIQMKRENIHIEIDRFGEEYELQTRIGEKVSESKSGRSENFLKNVTFDSAEDAVFDNGPYACNVISSDT
ncbi:hypothetical protein AVEN_257396-1 [Araneus ventricosus]|uniref:Uncharacterized protein n=1 Tax=Araneus ventricosus TaxID=182803 RepID=A0A4Y2E5C5_ARAVE|nr:hypothetical protein AVEN_30322-1 [Araneus ventricosus]GBM24091.1 hypothetical protein AVEN_103668-1 [Araneus ventricosus]GBM24107.1 hypothetical protein AVEN_257396-1 [Araneus ventricosus]